KYYSSETYVSHTSSGNTLINKLYLLVRVYTLKQKQNLIAKFSPKGKLLDYGCGTGEFLKVCAKQNWSVTGMEPSERARKMALSASLHVHSSIDEIPDTEKYNAITLWHVLEHIPDLNPTIEKIIKLLDDNGSVFIAVPNMKSHDAKHYESSWAGYDVPRHLWHFTPTSMKKLIEKHHLKLIDTIPMKLDSYYVSMLSEKYNKTPALLALIKGLFTGFFSNLSARKTGQYSSLIYIIRK